MIILEEFLNKIYSEPRKEPPMVWIYHGRASFDPSDKYSGLLCVHKSCFVARESLNEKILNKIVAEIYWTQDGIVLCVID